MNFAIKIYDKPDVTHLRDKIRQSHLDYLKACEQQTLFAGPMITDDGELELGSVRVMDFPTRAAAEAHVADEPYVLGGAQTPGTVERWEPGVPYSWRDCPRVEGYLQLLIHALDKPGSAELRESSADAQRRYYADHPSAYITRQTTCHLEIARSIPSYRCTISN